MDATLIIMAAGIGSRFGTGIKQLAKMAPNGEIIMDFSIYDAKEAGFTKIVFVIRKAIEQEFKEIIGDRLSRFMPVEYVYQELDDLPEGYLLPEGRVKPWGTGQAILACKNVVKEPFVIINADDYYGKEAFVKVHDYLVNCGNTKYQYCMAGFILDNTLSDNGTVTRGVCQVDDEEMLQKIVETSGIARDTDGIVKDENGSEIPEGTHVSMNMWGVTPEFLDVLDKGFAEFLANVEPGNIKAEYLLPTIIGDMLANGKVTVKVLETQDKWFGVTYQEDRQTVVDAFAQLIADGVYKTPLF